MYWAASLWLVGILLARTVYADEPTSSPAKGNSLAMTAVFVAAGLLGFNCVFLAVYRAARYFSRESAKFSKKGGVANSKKGGIANKVSGTKKAARTVV